MMKERKGDEKTLSFVLLKINKRKDRNLWDCDTWKKKKGNKEGKRGDKTFRKGKKEGKWEEKRERFVIRIIWMVGWFLFYGVSALFGLFNAESSGFEEQFLIEYLCCFFSKSISV